MQIFQSETVVVERDPDGSVVLKLDVPGRSVNVFNRQVLADLDAALDAVAASKAPLLVIRSGKTSGFVAGADLHEFLAIKDAAERRGDLRPRGQKLFDKLAGLPMPTRRRASAAPVWAAVWSWPWPAIIGSSSTSRARNSACRRSSWACCRAGAARSACRASSAWSGPCE